MHNKTIHKGVLIAGIGLAPVTRVFTLPEVAVTYSDNSNRVRNHSYPWYQKDRRRGK